MATDIATTRAEAIFRLLTLKMASVQVVETSVAINSPSYDSSYPGDHFNQDNVTPGFKTFSSIFFVIKSLVSNDFLFRFSYLAAGTFFLPTVTEVILTSCCTGPI